VKTIRDPMDGVGDFVDGKSVGGMNNGVDGYWRRHDRDASGRKHLGGNLRQLSERKEESIL